MLALAFLAGAALRADGAKVYTARCQSCHGRTGQGNAALANVYGAGLRLNDPQTLEKSDEALAAAIRDGGAAGRTHVFGGKLKPEEIDALVGHLRKITQ